MSCPRYEVASSLRFCSASATSWSVHWWLDGRGSAQDLREASHHPSLGTRRSANVLRHLRRHQSRIPIHGGIAPSKLAEPAPCASGMVAAGNGCPRATRCLLDKSEFDESSLALRWYHASRCCQDTWCADFPNSATGRDRTARALAPWSRETGPQLRRD